MNRMLVFASFAIGSIVVGCGGRIDDDPEIAADAASDGDSAPAPSTDGETPALKPDSASVPAKCPVCPEGQMCFHSRFADCAPYCASLLSIGPCFLFCGGGVPNNRYRIIDGQGYCY